MNIGYDRPCTMRSSSFMFTFVKKYACEIVRNLIFNNHKYCRFLSEIQITERIFQCEFFFQADWRSFQDVLCRRASSQVMMLWQ